MKFGIDLLRHLFCIAVLVQHMPSESRYSEATGAQLMQVIGWVDGAVVGFFFLSGFLFKRPDRWSRYAVQQSKKLLLPFFVFSMAYAVLMHLLDKRPLATGLWLTLTLKGSAAQLYFLTHLFVLTLAYAAWERCFNRRAVWAHAVLLACAVGLTLALPMPGSAGSDFRLMPLYVAAFVFGALFHLHRNAAKRLPVKGQTDWRVMGWLHAALLLTVALLGLTLDTRLITLFGVISLIAGAMVFFPLLPDRRLPGSGGVYLFHTPILNYAVSTALVSLSIVQRPNLVLSVLITYGLSLLFTLALIRYWPALRGHVLE